MAFSSLKQAALALVSVVLGLALVFGACLTWVTISSQAVNLFTSSQWVRFGPLAVLGWGTLLVLIGGHDLSTPRNVLKMPKLRRL